MTEHRNVTSLLESLTKNNNLFQRYTLHKFNRINEEEEKRKEMAMYQCTAGERNESYNRYSNILPYDRSRITLTNELMGQNHYINANLIVAPHGISQRYIATQGPLRNTIIDFWRTVIEYNVFLVVCLTPVTENGSEKCAQYWPETEKELIIQNENLRIKVQNIEEKQYNHEADCMIRKIGVGFYLNGQKIKETSVVHLQFLGWPDHGVPDKPDQLVALIRLARFHNKIFHPMLVHCSAGCGRTGAFCVIDAAEQLIKINQVVFDPIAYLTEEFRKYRMTLVETQNQFNFCYMALLKLLKEDE